MHIKSKILSGVYTDSMSLMALSTKVNKLPGVHKAMVGMGTDMNKEVIRDVGLMTPELESATPSDMMYVVDCETEARCDEVLEEIELMRTAVASEQANSAQYSTLNQAVQDSDSSLVVISVPGEYAAAEARTALEQGKNVMIFSDNVAIEDELSLKQYAHEKELLVMGPDCGTAIINGVGLCFANAVKEGSIGVVAASGTGSQELSVQIDTLGGGISQLVGVGGRDLSEEIGGIMMIDGMNMLANDSNTDVIVLLSKPPAESVAQKVLEQAKSISKPIIVCFIGDSHKENTGNLFFTNNTLEAAHEALKQAGISALTTTETTEDYKAITDKFSENQQWIRGVFCGGTICDEVFYVVKNKLPDVYSNVAKDPANVLPVGQPSRNHSMLDLGSDEFTRGRAHPMIDPAVRNQRIIEEAKDPETAIILLDFVLGYGSNENPVEAAAESIQAAFETANSAGRHLEIIAYVLGTDRDPQQKSQQIAALQKLGVRTVNNVIELGEVALKIISK